MSYPGRPPMVPGMPVPPPGITQLPYMGMGGPPPMMMPTHLIPPPMPQSAPPNPVIRAPFRPNMSNQAPRPLMAKRVPEPSSMQAVTVFVGNITERAPDAMIRHILSACGTVNSWKRVQGTTGRAPAFGFCEYASPDSGLRAVRLMHDFEIGGKKLVVKVDTKTKEVLDEYKNEKRLKLGRNNSGSSPLQDEAPTAVDDESNDYMDDEMKAVDATALSRISSILNDYNKDIENYTPPVKRSGGKDKNSTKPQENFLKLAQGSMASGPGLDGGPNFDDGEMEEGKRDLITREIGKFREIMKQEEEKEAERRRREARDKERRDRDVGPKSPHYRRDRASPSSPPRSSRSPPPLPTRSRRISVSPPPPPRSSRPQPPSRSPSPEGSFSNKLRSKGRGEREWRRSRSRSRERERERDREPDVKRTEKDIQKEREMEEEAKDKKKAERKAREKEAAYQERLRNWEGREKRKAKEYNKEKDKDRKQSDEMAKEGRRLKEFLEDYDDERDDPKFYKGRELGRRLALREQEIEADARDRAKERDELEEIKAQIFSDKECTNPLAEFEKIKQDHDALYQPKILVKVESKQAAPVRPNSPSLENEGSLSSMPSKNVSPWRPPQEDISTSAMMSPPQPTTFRQQNIGDQEDSQLSAVSQTSMGMDVSSPMGGGDSSSRGFSNWNKSPSGRESGTKASSPSHSNAAVPSKKRKLEIKEVFNTEDDDDSSLGTGAGRKRKPLVPLDYGEEKVLKKKDAEAGNSKATQEEKRKHIKSLIDKIPTDKEALFAFSIDWGAVDSNLMEKRIRPWINKKIIEYIGEPEPALVDFICSKVILGSDPKGILDDVQMVLDEEAEVFVVKMWRLLIYEIESKKLGLVK
ncbi:RNA-binding protein 25-like isoform X2 [Neocloeon triangulifer]|uniref:RNA-binding protein 25-like isoform X2 n=1 Tax=Neocloeon triangulifer TaxID=2078957 RepID=UPI00286F48A4|nr:RNA-binding protein 25-like isoform X2 [Neocloeon triangulifer]